MLSAVIRSRHSYGAMHLAVQPLDQRSVHFGPLVLETALLKNQRLQQIKPNLSHACFSHITVCIGLYLHPSKISGWLTSSLYGRSQTSLRGGGVVISGDPKEPPIFPPAQCCAFRPYEQSGSTSPAGTCAPDWLECTTSQRSLRTSLGVVLQLLE